MFSDSKSKSKKQEVTDHTKDQNRISKGTTITGDIESQGVFRVEGTLIGNLKTTKKIVIGKSGRIEGDIYCGDADVEGAVKGKIVADNMLSLKPSCEVTGDVSAKSLSVEPGAHLNGSCSMKTATDNVKDISESEGTPKRREERRQA